MKRKIVTYAGLLLLSLLLGVSFTSCTKEDLEPTASGRLSLDDIKTIELFRNLGDAPYDVMTSTNYYGANVILIGELRADNCVANGNSGRFLPYSDGSLTKKNAEAAGAWRAIYSTIAHANAVLTFENHSFGTDPLTVFLHRHILGEAYAVRALAHYDLLRLFGAQHVAGANAGIPYVTEYRPKNTQPARNSVSEVKAMLYADIEKALEYLGTNPPETKIPIEKRRIEEYRSMRHRMHYDAAHVVRARIALWFGDWDAAMASAEVVENSGRYSIIPGDQYAASWKRKMNGNSIFELVNTETDNANIYSISNFYNGDSYADAAATQDIKDVFEPGDVRGTDAMIGINEGLRSATRGSLGWYLGNLGKYTDAESYIDNVVLMRFEEVKLIKAEALVMKAKGPSAAATVLLNEITSQRNASPYVGDVTIEDVLKERRKELCFEGFRFDDLARHGKDIPACKVGPLIKVAPKHGTHLFALPIPEAETNANANIGQNLGY